MCTCNILFQWSMFHTYRENTNRIVVVRLVKTPKNVKCEIKLSQWFCEGYFGNDLPVLVSELALSHFSMVCRACTPARFVSVHMWMDHVTGLRLPKKLTSITTSSSGNNDHQLCDHTFQKCIGNGSYKIS